MNPFKKYWEGLSERKQAGIRYAANIFILVFTVWVSVSVISYICNWKEDQSALAAGGAVQNAAASTGLSAGHFLVTDSFGLAALCLVLFLLVLCLKRFWSGCRASLRKWFYGMLSFSFILSSRENRNAALLLDSCLLGLESVSREYGSNYLTISDQEV